MLALHGVRGGEVRRQPAGPGGELVDERVVRSAASRPLGVEVCGRVRHGPVRGVREKGGDQLVREQAAHRPEHVRVERRAAVAGPVDDVDGVPGLDEERRPAGAAVGRAEIVGALTAAAVDAHDRVRLRHGLGRLPLDEDLAARNGPLRQRDGVADHPEEAAAGGDDLAVELPRAGHARVATDSRSSWGFTSDAKSSKVRLASSNVMSPVGI